jgi:hypothetical protein
VASASVASSVIDSFSATEGFKSCKRTITRRWYNKWTSRRVLLFFFPLSSYLLVLGLFPLASRERKEQGMVIRWGKRCTYAVPAGMYTWATVSLTSSRLLRKPHSRPILSVHPAHPHYSPPPNSSPGSRPILAQFSPSIPPIRTIPLRPIPHPALAQISPALPPIPHFFSTYAPIISFPSPPKGPRLRPVTALPFTSRARLHPIASNSPAAIRENLRNNTIALLCFEDVGYITRARSSTILSTILNLKRKRRQKRRDRRIYIGIYKTELYNID